jgi:hypothetical protein
VLTLFADGKEVGNAVFPYRRTGTSGRCTLAPDPANLSAHVFLFRKPIAAKVWSFAIEPEDVRPKFEDTAVSEWTFLVDGAPLPRAVSPAVAFAAELIERLARSATADSLDLAPGSYVTDPYTTLEDREVLGFDATEAQRDQLDERGLSTAETPVENFLRLIVDGQSFVKAAVTIVPDANGGELLVGGSAFWFGGEGAPREVRWHPAVRVKTMDGRRRVVEAGAMIWLGGRCKKWHDCERSCDVELRGLDRPL